LHPHVLCMTEHHFKYSQLNNVHIESYNLRAYHCRELREKGGVAIFVHNGLYLSNTDIVKHCNKQDIEICALKLAFSIENTCINTSLSRFLLRLDILLQLLYASTLHIIICGNININYLMESEKKKYITFI